MPLQPGQSLLHYRLTEKIGQGGMGEVWKAVDTTLDRSVAIRVLPEIFATDRERLTRFEREAKILASLQHSGIASIFSFQELDGVRFLAMELVPGEDLSQRVARGPIGLDEALGLARQIAGALEVAHENGIVHRDLKPANVLITPDGQAKVLDFGLAKAFGSDAASSSPNLSMSPTEEAVGEARSAPARRGRWIAVVAVALVAGLLAGRAIFTPAPTPPLSVAFEITTSGGRLQNGSLALSPDGRYLVFQVRLPGGKNELWLRALDSTKTRPLPGTLEASRPFWSPDSKEIAFFTGSELRKIALDGTAPRLITTVSSPAGGTWNRDGVILYGDASGPIRRVDATGGTSQQVTTKASDEDGATPLDLAARRLGDASRLIVDGVFPLGSQHAAALPLRTTTSWRSKPPMETWNW